MGTLKWYKRDPRAAIQGMMQLKPDERGIYNTILDLIYINDGALVDDAEAIKVWLNCDIRTWKRIRTRLLVLGKLYLHAGCLRNERADHEVDQALGRVRSSVEAASKRWATHNEIKKLGDAPAMLSTSTSRKLLFPYLSTVPKPKK